MPSRSAAEQQTDMQKPVGLHLQPCHLTIQPMVSPPLADAMPLPPHQPDLEACCGDGCDPCIFDMHDMALDAYRQALRGWRVRNPEAERPQTGISSQS